MFFYTLVFSQLRSPAVLFHQTAPTLTFYLEKQKNWALKSVFFVRGEDDLKAKNASILKRNLIKFNYLILFFQYVKNWRRRSNITWNYPLQFLEGIIVPIRSFFWNYHLFFTLKYQFFSEKMDQVAALRLLWEYPLHRASAELHRCLFWNWIKKYPYLQLKSEVTFFSGVFPQKFYRRKQLIA